MTTSYLEADLLAQRAPDLSSHRLVFVGGLHRSGTTVVARQLARHPDVSTLTGTGVPENEGEHLQSVYTDSWELGGVGQFGFHPAAHITEQDSLVSDASRRTLAWELSRYWDLTRPLLLEKSPPNMLKMRFLQALFPSAYFIVVVRHPVAVTLATLKWRNRLQRPWSPPGLLEHWLCCHEVLLEDRPHVARLAIVRYENFVLDPAGELAGLFRFLGRSPIAAQPDLPTGLNERYFQKWRAMRRKPLYGQWLAGVEQSQSRVERFGYSLRELNDYGRWAWDIGTTQRGQTINA